MIIIHYVVHTTQVHISNTKFTANVKHLINGYAFIYVNFIIVKDEIFLMTEHLDNLKMT